MMNTRKIIYSLLTASIFLSCNKDPQIFVNDNNNNIYDIQFKVPEGWPSPVYNFSDNPVTEDGFKLGRKLFYEQRLSRDNTISCGSCHQDFAAFANAAHPLSHGIDGLFGIRNAPGLFNLAWKSEFNWDGGVNHIEIQPFAPISNPVEMDEKLENIIKKLNDDALYRKMFKDAFGSEEINSQKIFKAITQFQGLMISNNSKYDKIARGEKNVNFTESELRGLNLFTSKKCNSCHTPPLFSNFEYVNNGLSVNNILLDSGRAHITANPSDRYKFKVPSLRNVALTSPYMHDGRFNTLYECLNHYRNEITNKENLHPILTNGINLSDSEINDLIDFLKTLSDFDFVKDKRFHDPN